MRLRTTVVAAMCGALMGLSLPAQTPADTSVQIRNDSLSIRLVDADLRLALQTLARFLDRPLVFGNIGEHRVSFETPQLVPKAAVPRLVEGILQTFGMKLEEEPDYYAVGNAISEPPPSVVPAQQAIQLFAVQVRHARAADVAATIAALYGQPGAMGEIGAPMTGAAAVPATGSPANSAGGLPAAGGSADSITSAPLVARVAQLSGEIRIVPDPRTNSLLIRATREDFQLIEATVEQLDVRPLQVLIEVVIAEVRRDRSLALGVGAELSSSPIQGANGTEWSASTPSVGLGDLVLSMLQLGKVDVAATLQAAASRGDVSILSRPVLLAANNSPAEIVVGSQRPFVQVQRALPTDAPVRDQVVQYKDVGTRLNVTATVSQDGYVMLEVVQEVSAATAEVAFDAPVISTRVVRTHLLVKDGHTAVMGGLGDRQHEVIRSGIPVLSSIPLLGALFGTHSTRTTETELFVFLTPRVIRTDQELDQASDSVGSGTKALRRP